MTSPPYWALRDYGVEGQIGNEESPEKYVNNLCNIFDEVKRVLKKTGTCWVNIGDTYGGTGNKGEHRDPKYKDGRNGQKIALNSKFQKKSLLQIPSMFALEMTKRGWILRNEIIWLKKNVNPSSVKDRFTVDFEKIYFFTKNTKYFFETQKEKAIGFGSRNKRTTWSINTKPFKKAHFAIYPEKLCVSPLDAGCPLYICDKCGIIREKIFERIDNSDESNIKDESTKMSKTEDNIDSVGGRKYYLSIQRKFIMPKRFNILFSKFLKENLKGKEDILNKMFNEETWKHWIRTDIGGTSLPTIEDYSVLKNIINIPNNFNKWFEPTVSRIVDDKDSKKFYSYMEECYCGNNNYKSGVVLDPFMGSGTTGVVAIKQNKNFIGIELNKEYIDIAVERLEEFK